MREQSAVSDEQATGHGIGGTGNGIAATADAFLRQVVSRVEQLATGASLDSLAAAGELVATALQSDGVVHAFGTGHSEAFSMEIAGRAGGLIPTNRIALRDVVLDGKRPLAALAGAGLERDATVVTELLDGLSLHPADVFLIASNSGVNGSVVEMALQVTARGHGLIAVTSLEHTNAVEPKHPSGKRLSEIADVVIDNLAPYGDSTLFLGGSGTDGGIGVGAVSSLTAAFIAQVITIDATQRIQQSGATPPVYVSANVPGGDEQNQALEDRYRGRIRRLA